ncbi:MAG: hypothetical protein V1706_07975 [Pseudomonadota bacterium]
MNKGLLALDENLASSIALRYAARLVEILPLQLQAGHVEIPDAKQQLKGTGWVRRTWEQGVMDAGHQAIQRLLNTEKVGCPFVGIPKVFVGDRDGELLEELGNGGYDLFVEGYLNTSNADDFYKLVSSPLYAKSPCPMMVVKNLVSGNRVALLCGDGVDHKALIPGALKLLNGDGLDFDLLYYRYQENESLVLLEKEEAGSVLSEAEEMLRAAKRQVMSSQAVCGTPEGVAGMLKKYMVVVSSFPLRKSPRLELLAQCPSPVLFFK